jgi:hypothetical protein
MNRLLNSFLALGIVLGAAEFTVANDKTGAARERRP